MEACPAAAKGGLGDLSRAGFEMLDESGTFAETPKSSSSFCGSGALLDRDAEAAGRSAPDP